MMDMFYTISSLFGILFFVLLIHMIVIEKYHKQEKNDKAVIKRDLMGSPIHTIFVVGDGFILMVLYGLFKPLIEKEPMLMIAIGTITILLATIFYRWLQIWFEKFNISRIRDF